jgi:opacity protein-like surface antigen
MAMKRYSVERLCCFWGFLAAATISPAQAADVGSSANVGYAAVEMSGSWTGFNIGTGVSAGGISTEVRGPSGTKFTMLDGEGIGPFMPWLTAGYNIQFGAFMVGIAANLTYDEAKQRHSDLALGSIKIYQQDFGSLQLRAGYVFDNLFVYGTAGFELTKNSVSGNLLPVADRKIDFAPIAGIGVDYALDRSRTLLIRAEAKIYWIDEKNIEFTTGVREANADIGVISIGFVRKY